MVQPSGSIAYQFGRDLGSNESEAFDPYIVGYRLGLSKQAVAGDFLGGIKQFWSGLGQRGQRALIGGGLGLLGGSLLGRGSGALLGGLAGAGLGYFGQQLLPQLFGPRQQEPTGPPPAVQPQPVPTGTTQIKPVAGAPGPITPFARPPVPGEIAGIAPTPGPAAIFPESATVQPTAGLQPSLEGVHYPDLESAQAMAKHELEQYETAGMTGTSDYERVLERAKNVGAVPSDVPDLRGDFITGLRQTPARVALYQDKPAPTSQQIQSQLARADATGRDLSNIRTSFIAGGATPENAPAFATKLQTALREHVAESTYAEPLPAEDGKYYTVNPAGERVQIPTIGNRVPQAFLQVPEARDANLNSVMEQDIKDARTEFWADHKATQTATAELNTATRNYNEAAAQGINTRRGLGGLSESERRDYGQMQRMQGRIIGGGRAVDQRLRESAIERLEAKMNSNPQLERLRNAQANYRHGIKRYENHFTRPNFNSAERVGSYLMVDHPIVGRVIYDHDRGYIKHGTGVQKPGETFATTNDLIEGENIFHNEWLPGAVDRDGNMRGIRIVNNRWYPAMVDPKEGVAVTGIRRIDELAEGWDPDRPYERSTVRDAKGREIKQSIEAALAPISFGKSLMARLALSTELGLGLFGAKRKYPTGTPFVGGRVETPYEEAWHQMTKALPEMWERAKEELR